MFAEQQEAFGIWRRSREGRRVWIRFFPVCAFVRVWVCVWNRQKTSWRRSQTPRMTPGENWKTVRRKNVSRRLSTKTASYSYVTAITRRGTCRMKRNQLNMLHELLHNHSETNEQWSQKLSGFFRICQWILRLMIVTRKVINISLKIRISRRLNLNRSQTPQILAPPRVFQQLYRQHRDWDPQIRVFLHEFSIQLSRANVWRRDSPTLERFVTQNFWGQAVPFRGIQAGGVMWTQPLDFAKVWLQ